MRRTRVLLFGKNGQLGSELSTLLAGSCELHALGTRQVNFEDVAQLRDSIRRHAPRAIINAAAYTAVDDAEQHGELAHRINADAPRIIAEEARSAGALLIHYSTDYVFDGAKSDPYTELDETRPLNVYGASKLAGEHAIQGSECTHIILRISWLYAPHGKNFYRTVLRRAAENAPMRIVNDQYGSPTSSLEVARATARLLERVAHGSSAAEFSGIYHMTGPGRTTWYDFAREVLRRAGPDSPPEIVPISTSEYVAPARRPRNSMLNSDKLSRSFGITLPSWEAQLHEVVALSANPDSAST